MIHKAVQVRIYPSKEQETQLAQSFGCARWWWNYALNKSVETYKETGKGLSRAALNAFLPALKKSDDTIWLADCYSQILQATTLNLTTAYKNFFDKRAGFPKFKSKHGKQSIQYPQNVKIVDGHVKLPGNIGIVKAKIHRPIEGKIKTVTISKTPSGKYLASILTEVEGVSTPLNTSENTTISEGKIYGIDLGLKHFAVVTDGENVSKYENPKHLAKHEKNLKRKQKKLARKQKGSKSRNRYRKVVAKVYERVSNSRQDFLHKLSYKLVSDSQAVIVENLNVKGMVRNHNLAKSISDAGWGTFTNFLAYKLERKGGKLVEIDRWFPSSRLCSHCFYQVSDMPLSVREWTCPHCGTHHDRDGNAAINIRAEGIRIIKAEGSAVSAVGGEIKPKLGRKSKLRHSPVSTEADTVLGTPSQCG
ncbi:IS200/IS605 family element transposase accessory protein TnpB [Anabaena cylindrica FACHB-243]|uniref:Transposase, IS605 OrfB family n=1 Tax=Anabaena cylindrica (strain ATCC 27899 / PCC 7122) TaxID=272123 RepID=K9ZKP8_ANACC|nr:MULTISPECIES: RNA-guided endonuclease TnpB family protein [Anabaena]AFZ59132.1 transposase, IS605 OrfB family [Anabaena cylindrica PCC 7122]MBD2419237.1 IS200/IS605 family element transposase accessory protein TnpB [Anabaena cylindrica FACHB-243]MBY5284578.1 IS200/IS605 family element transposase accessory protein TnpB [Anabaena sp. CCAP 1446/1C]MBY5311604.1 IS200/IS605 family element transposase accessory protein TnpB [Anabaena sp. CCAP 1446/1C]MCM2409918.1 transposase [Anabaena sp. CCAP 1